MFFRAMGFKKVKSQVNESTSENEYVMEWNKSDGEKVSFIYSRRPAVTRAFFLPLRPSAKPRKIWEVITPELPLAPMSKPPEKALAKS